MSENSLSERDIDRLLSGRELSDGTDAELAAFLGSARRVLRVPPGEKAEAAHLVKIVAAARTAAQTGSEANAPASQTPQHVKSVQSRNLGLRIRTAAAKVGIAALGMTTATAGLAMAGVNLPGNVAEKVFGAVGIDLPNQGKGDDKNQNPGDTSERVHRAQERARQASVWGCEFGAAVSRAARGDDGESDPAHCRAKDKSGRPGSQGHAKGHQKNSGRKDTSPGHGGTNPGRKDTHPGHEDNPGHGGDNPGHGGDNPGQGEDNPGQGEDNPGHGGDNPGNADNSGQDDSDDSEDDDSDDDDSGDDDDNSGHGNGDDSSGNGKDNSGKGSGDSVEK